MSFIDDFLNSFPAEVGGIPTIPLIGLIIGVAIACYEGIWVKFKKYKLKVGDTEVPFKKIYLGSAIVSIIVIVVTIYAVKELKVLNGIAIDNVSGGISAAVVGFTEGMVTLRTLNTRIDNFLMSASLKSGATEEQAQAIAKAVDVVEVEETVTSDPVIEEKKVETPKKVKTNPTAFTETPAEEERSDMPVSEKIKLKSL